MKIYTIKKTSGISIGQLCSALSNDGRIMTYCYCISIVAMTFRLTSSPYFIRPGERPSKYRLWYNICSLIFGWWGLPWGPIYTIDLLRINQSKEGGIDVTEDLLPKILQKYSGLNQVQPFDLTIEYNQNELTN